MAAILNNLRNTIIVGLILAVIMLVAFAQVSPHHFNDTAYWQAVFRWMHVFFGILWIGLLYYFNFVQIPTMPKIPAELKPAVSKHIAPAALFWFRWAAAFTVLFGLVTAGIKDDIALTLEVRPPYTTIGIGMWLAIIMAANVWFIIWPNQKKALGIVPADDAAKAKAGRVAMIASRTNTVLSLPMLYCMVMQGAALTIG
jgi:uncharacterized membrane protein